METISRQVRLDISSEALWAAITDRETLEAWLGERVDIDLRPGGAGTIVDDGVKRDVVVQRVDDGRGWSFEWQVDEAPVSTVSFEISSDNEASVLTITETLHAETLHAETLHAQASTGTGGGFRWELCALLLWACTAAVAMVR